MDNIIVTSNDVVMVQSCIACTRGEFSTTDLGSLNYFLGPEVLYTTESLFVVQAKYALDIFGMGEIARSKTGDYSLGGR